MAAVVVDLVSYYAAYIVALGGALGIAWVHGDLTPLMALPAGIFVLCQQHVPMALLWVSRGRTLPGWLERLPLIKPALRALSEATPAIAHDVSLITQCTGLQLAILMLDAGTLWIMLWALGFFSQSSASLCELHALDTGANAWSGSWRAWGFRGCLRSHAQAHRSAGCGRSRGNTPLPFLHLLLPMAPGLFLARREARA